MPRMASAGPRPSPTPKRHANRKPMRGGARPGAGRPRKPDGYGVSATKINVALSPTQRDQLGILTARWGVSPADAIRGAIELTVAGLDSPGLQKFTTAAASLTASAP